ncbi:MAG: hypothetical protein PF545_04875 [Elusimicrobia bacterium]|jgi:hypothetical protein|nr:hypothetical protein [Elusimicrobiota bacterium]
MNIRKIFTTVAGLLVLLAPLSSAQLVPYYNYQFTEGVSASPEGDLGFIINLSNDIGTIFKPLPAHTFIGFYSLKYQGPGLKRQEGREFSERYMDHIFVGRHHWNIRGDLILKTQSDILLEGRRSGTNETWESGLYNFNRYGGASYLTKKYSKDFIGTASFGYHYMTFPNYTDMLAEIRSGADPSASEGKQNHHVLNQSVKTKYKNNTAKFSLTEQLYSKQKVAVDNVQSDGTYYSSTKQKDMTVGLSADRVEGLSKIMIINPGISITYKNSNQNYQHFETATSTNPVKFFKDYYDYLDFGLNIPYTLMLSRKWSFVFSPDISYKIYTKRQPRDQDGNFKDKKQSRFLGVYTMGFKKQIGESSSSLMYFTYQNQVANMTYERYVAYNYSAFSTGFKFQMEY